MPSEHGEIRYDRADLLEDCRAIANLLDDHGRVSFKYAAFGTLHTFSAIDSYDLLTGEGGDPPLWLGGQFGMPDGVGDPRLRGTTHTLWVKHNGGDRGNTGTSAWLAKGGYHVPEYMAEKFTRNGNPTDALGLAVLLLLVEASRDAGPLRIDIEDTIKTWVEQSPERDLPAFMTKGESRDG